MARVFVFELDPVIEVRRRAEREHMARVAKLERERVVLLERVREVQENMAGARASLGELLGGQGTGDGAAPTRVSAVNMHAVKMQANASLHGVIALQRAALELAGLSRRVEAARAELLKAAVARKAVEKLRERRFAMWKREQAMKEAMEMDDLTVMRGASVGREVESGGSVSSTGSRTSGAYGASPVSRRGPMELASMSHSAAGAAGDELDAVRDGAGGEREDGASE